MVIHIFFFQPTRVSGESMMPTLKNGEYLIVSKWSHVMGEVPNYGDIVIIDSRVQYPRTWKDDVAEPMNNYLAFFDHDLQTKNVGSNELSAAPVIRWLSTTERFGAMGNRWMNLYQRSDGIQQSGRS